MGPVASGIPPGIAGALLGLAVALPLAGLVLLLFPRTRSRVPGLTPWIPLPALVAALIAPEGTVLELPWVLTGIRPEMDALARPFLLLAGVLWPAAGAFLLGASAQPSRTWLCGFYLAALAGNLGVILAPGAVGFYAFYTIMGLAIYGLVIAEGGEQAHRAANVYLAFTVLGEVLLFGALAAAGGDGGVPAGIAPLALAGLGVKLGLVPLHMWMPLAYGAAPSAAGAVLGGSMVNAGLIGWLRFLPLGEAVLPGWGQALVALGLAAAFLGVVAGLAQREARVVLAYSSISQMGWITAAVGAGLLAPEYWHQGLLAGVVAYAVHHGLVKGALFLAAGTAPGERPGSGRALLAWIALGVLALVMAGGPGTSGAAAKLALKEALAYLPGADPAAVANLLAWGAAATTLLMVRFLALARPAGTGTPVGRPAWAALGLLAVLVLALPFAWRPLRPEALASLGPEAGTVGLPVGLAALVGVGVALGLQGRPWIRSMNLPPGDLLWLLAAGVRPLRGAVERLGARLWPWWVPANRLGGWIRTALWVPVRSRLMAADRWGWTASGIALLILLGALILALLPWR